MKERMLRLLPFLAVGLLMVLLPEAMANENQNQGLSSLVITLRNAFCPIVKVLVGPLPWIVAFVVFVIGIILLAAGGRGAIRTMIMAFLVVALLVGGKAWLNSQMSTVQDEQNILVECGVRNSSR